MPATAAGRKFIMRYAPEQCVRDNRPYAGSGMEIKRTGWTVTVHPIIRPREKGGPEGPGKKGRPEGRAKGGRLRESGQKGRPGRVGQEGSATSSRRGRVGQDGRLGRAAKLTFT